MKTSKTVSELLIEIQTIESKLNEFGLILSMSPRGPFGLTLDYAKTDEWKEARKQYEIWFSKLREANKKLCKMRKHIGYELINGKRVSVYKELV